MSNDIYHTNVEVLNAAKRMVEEHEEGLFNSMLTIAGGALVLSLSFVEYFSFDKSTMYVLKIAWLFLASNIVLNSLTRFFFNKVKMINVNKAHFKLENPTENIEAFFERYRPERVPAWVATICQWAFWITFIAGLGILVYFVWINT